MVAALVAILATAAVSPLAAAARPAAGTGDAQQSAYLQGLFAARAALDSPGAPEATRASRALAVLYARAPAELELIGLLQSQPPDTLNARARLETTIEALQQAPRDPDPIVTEQHVRQVLAQARYHPDQGFLAGVLRFLARLLDSIFRPGQGLLSWFLILLLAGLVLLVLVLLVPALRNPLLRRRGVPAGGAVDEEGVPAYFATADRLAQGGDFAGAVRALVAGTMELISGERSFTASPLTVRETFGKSGAMQALWPMLQAFERSYYGHRDTGPEDYRAAAESARAYRAHLVPGSVAA